MQQRPTHSSSLHLTLSSCFLRAFFEETRTDAVAQRRLLEAVDIGAETLAADNGRITEDQFAALYRLMASESKDELLGLFSRPLPGGAMKFGGYIMIAAATVGVALHRYSRFVHMITDDVEIVVARENEIGSVTFVEPPGPRRCRTMGLELLLKVIHGVMSWLIGRNVSLISVDFAFAAPSHVDDLHTLFPGPIRFDRPATAITFDAALLDMNFRRTEQDLRTFLSRQPSEWLCSPSAKQPVTHLVRTCLLEKGVGSLGAAEIARSLNMSLRTLSRRLEGEQTTLKHIQDTLRRDLAIHRLTQTRDSISDIANTLGFGDIASFYRAFRGWTGVAPGAYRRDGGASHADA
jgi:AraC-like DNA-binding protein